MKKNSTTKQPLEDSKWDAIDATIHEVRNDYTAEDDNCTRIDVWTSDDDNADGFVVAVVCQDTGKVIWFKTEYMNSQKVKEAIEEVKPKPDSKEGLHTPLEDSKGTKNVHGYQLTDIQIMVFNKWCTAQSISMNTLQPEQRKEVVGMWLRNTGQKEVPTPDSKEGLHTQGDDWFISGGMVDGYEIRTKSGKVIISPHTTYPVSHEDAELIVKAVNDFTERRKQSEVDWYNAYKDANKNFIELAELCAKMKNERPELIKQRDAAIKELDYMVKEDQKHREETEKAANERKALLDSHRELQKSFDEAIQRLTDLYMEATDLERDKKEMDRPFIVATKEFIVSANKKQ